MKKPLAPKSAQTQEIADLLKVAAAKGAQEAPKAAPVKPEAVDKGLHALALKMVSAEAAHDKAANAVYATFKAYAIAALPIIAKSGAHMAAVLDIRTCYGEARVAAAIQRITMLNNMRTIAHGKPASRNTAAQAAQGVDLVISTLETCTSLPALKKALTLLKTEKHAATGVAKHTISDKPKAAPVKASDVVIPSTRAEAIKAACRILEMVSATFLTISKDAETIQEVAKVVKLLKAA